MRSMPWRIFAGIRTPWTRASDCSWEKTRRLAGPLFVAARRATLAAQAVAGGPTALHVMLAGLIAAALLFTGYLGILSWIPLGLLCAWIVLQPMRPAVS
jgi:type IV secretory pathway TrbD component